MFSRLFFVLLLAGLAGLAGCGGGGGSSLLDDRTGNNNNNNTNTAWEPGVFKPASDFESRCAAPRSGTDPYTGNSYPDRSGKTLDENNWLRSWSNETYLWYDEIIDLDPAEFDDPITYFSLLKTNDLTPSGAPKDQFHFTYDTAEWNALSGSGVSAGYGVTWAVINGVPPREIRVAYTEPNTPATAEGVELARGTLVLEVNGVDAVEDNTGAGVDTMNQGLFPSDTGQSVTLVVQDIGSDESRTVTLTSTTITSTPVQYVKTLESESGEQVGYLLFNDHIATSEELLIDAIDELSSAGATQLVLDLRYNGGGLLAIASQLAYMLAGDTPTADQVFYDISFNDKHPDRDPVTGQSLTPIPFYDRTLGFSTATGQPLPSLNLTRVYILTGANTCSASEAIINGLRGVDVEVIQIGTSTCGKPYGFYPTDNCGTTYFTVQFKGDNAKGFGEYSDGFTPGSNPADAASLPGCMVADDYLHALGDPAEARLAAALTYHETGECPAVSGTGMQKGLQKQARPMAEGYVHKPAALQNTILLPPDTGAEQ